jgi:hypothetical protein
VWLADCALCSRRSCRGGQQHRSALHSMLFELLQWVHMLVHLGKGVGAACPLLHYDSRCNRLRRMIAHCDRGRRCCACFNVRTCCFCLQELLAVHIFSALIAP